MFYLRKSAKFLVTLADILVDGLLILSAAFNNWNSVSNLRTLNEIESQYGPKDNR